MHTLSNKYVLFILRFSVFPSVLAPAALDLVSTVCHLPLGLHGPGRAEPPPPCWFPGKWHALATF
jgi:hypothetical protein